MDGKREFRTEASKAAERRHRSVLRPFLEAHDYRVTEDSPRKRGDAVEQFIFAVAPDGREIRARVRLCWRRDGRNPAEDRFSAAQLIARLRSQGDWTGTLDYLQEREQQRGLTHLLLSQDDQEGRILFAALVPIDAVKPIWEQQRSVADQLLQSPHAGRTAANQVMNGQSPTVWLMDERREDSHLIPDVLWSWPGVIRLGPAPSAPPPVSSSTLNDLLGRDGASAALRLISSYPRNPAVRLAVLHRAKGRCERPSCRASRPWSGFLDVHHILGVAESDRPQNCVALCPNCHREAHFGPDKDALNAALLKVTEAAVFEHPAPSEAGGA